MARERFDPLRLPSLQDRTFVVTGANSGLGRETCRILASAGADVVMACRNEAKAHEAIDDIRSDHEAARLEFIRLDLASLKSVRNFADALLARRPRIDVLINNAGVMAIPYRTTEDGFEMQWGVNHLGHFALTGLLLARLQQSPNARVVTVSSSAHQLAPDDFDRVTTEGGYAKWRAYGASKLANLWFAFELARRVSDAGGSLLSLACHPGYAHTNLQQVGPRMEGSTIGAKLSELSGRWIAQSAYMGALPTVYAAIDEHVGQGDFIGPDGMLQAWGYPTRVRAAKRAYDQAAARTLWERSEEWTGVRYPL